MTVRELLEALSRVEDQDAQVVLSSDAEGNSYYVLDEMALRPFMQRTPNEGDVYQLDDFEDLRQDGWTEEDFAKLRTSVVLYPS